MVYNENNKVTRVIKPDGSVTTTVYDDAQRVTQTAERAKNGQMITGFEYTYDNLGRIICEKHLAKNKILWYTYDKLSRVISKRVETADCCVLSEDSYTYDAAGNLLTDSKTGEQFAYDTNNRLISTCDCYRIDYDNWFYRDDKIGKGYQIIVR